METIFNQFISLAHTCLQFAINGIWLGVIIALSGALLLRFAGKMPASAKYKAWALFIIMAIVLPLTIGQSPELYGLLPEKGILLNENSKQPQFSLYEKSDTESPIIASKQSSTDKNILNRNDELEEAMVDVIETIDSEYDRDQIYAMLYKQYRSRKVIRH